MKKLFWGAAMLAIALCSSAETKQALTLHLATGARIVYFLDEQPVIGFEGQTMVVTISDESTDIPMQDVDRWEIGMAEYSGAPQASIGQASIAVYGQTVTVCNPSGGAIGVYDLSGRTIGTSTLAEAQFTLPAGIYIITVANNTYKIAVR